MGPHQASALPFEEELFVRNDFSSKDPSIALQIRTLGLIRTTLREVLIFIIRIVNIDNMVFSSCPYFSQ